MSCNFPWSDGMPFELYITETVAILTPSRGRSLERGGPVPHLFPGSWVNQSP